jgi:hypothetical protein
MLYLLISSRRALDKDGSIGGRGESREIEEQSRQRG